MRVFAGLPLPDEITQGMGRWMSQWQDRYPGWRIVRPQGLHITLHFFGETEESEVERLSETVNALKAPSIQASLGNVGFFPPRATPRVLFVDLRDGVAEVKNLYRTFHDLIRPLGYREQEREFVPHITIARNRGARSGRGRLERDQPVKIPPDWRSVGTMELLDGSFVINRLIIYASHLKPGGAEYVPLKQIPLL